MTKALGCPVCRDGHSLMRLDLVLPDGARLLRCPTCGGVVANHDAVAVAKEHYDRSHPLMVQHFTVPRCRACQLPLPEGARICPHCRKSAKLACPGCRATMEVVGVAGVTLDACGHCQLAFFDRGEFADVCRSPSAFARALRASVPVVAGAMVPAQNVSADQIALDVLSLPAESLGTVVHVAHAAGSGALEVASSVAEGLGQLDASVVADAAEIALEAGSAAADGFSVVGAVLEILGALFD